MIVAAPAVTVLLGVEKAMHAARADYHMILQNAQISRIFQHDNFIHVLHLWSMFQSSISFRTA